MAVSMLGLMLLASGEECVNVLFRIQVIDIRTAKRSAHSH